MCHELGLSWAICDLQPLELELLLFSAHHPYEPRNQLGEERQAILHPGSSQGRDTRGIWGVARAAVGRLAPDSHKVDTGSSEHPP